MLYKLWEDGKVGSLDDPLEKYVENFTIKNPLGRAPNSELKYVTDGLIFLDSGEVQIRSSSVTLRRMASQLSGELRVCVCLSFSLCVHKCLCVGVCECGRITFMCGCVTTYQIINTCRGE